MTATALQAWIAVTGALLAGVLGIFRYFTYRTRRDRISLVGQAFNSTVEGLSSDADAKKLAAAILLRRFFDKETEQGAVGKPYEREAIAVIAALLRNTPAGELQKLLADGLAYASSLEAADLQECNLSRSYLGQRQRSVVAHASIRLLSARRRSFRRTDDLGRSSASVPINLTGADLFHADLTSASLRDAIAENAVFYTAIARRTVFEGAHLEGADFREAELEGARFIGAWLERAKFEGALNVPPEVSQLLDKSQQVPPGRGMPVPAIKEAASADHP